MQQQVRAALFDLDGVLVFTDRYHCRAWHRLAKDEGWTFDAQLNDRLRGVSRLASLQVILEHNGLTLDAAACVQLADRKNRYYVESLQEMSTADLYPGARELLRSLRWRGIKLGLCSASRNAPEVLERLELSQWFSATITGADIVRSKPDPEIFLKGAAALGMARHNCVVFEDAPAGITAAKAAGMKCIGVGTAALLEEADWVVTNYADLPLDELFGVERQSAPA
jgi:beta-phosphoglucomutase